MILDQPGFRRRLNGRANVPEMVQLKDVKGRLFFWLSLTLTVEYNFRVLKKGPSRLHPPYKRTGDQFWSRTGRARKDGQQFFGVFLGRAIFFKEKHRGKLDG